MLDKAYLALISQKFTGNNIRNAAFEQDSKAIEDIRSLLTTTDVKATVEPYHNITNCIISFLPSDLMYYVTANAKIYESQQNPTYIHLISHQNALNFIHTDSNMPWIKNPVSFIESNNLIILYDPYKKDDINVDEISITYIKKPIMFSDTISEWNDTTFELTDSVVEELITLAIIVSLENVESQRLNTKIQTRQIES